MTFDESLFWILAVIATGSAGMILLARGIVHMAFWLLASLAGFAGLYLHLGADFLGFAQVIVYIGGILILFLFGVMLTHRGDVPVRQEFSLKILVPGVIAGLAVTGFVVFVSLAGPWTQRAPDQVVTLGPAVPGVPAAEPTAEDIGGRFMSTYILPFEVVSLLLLIAMVGATYIARSGEEGEGEEAEP